MEEFQTRKIDLPINNLQRVTTDLEVGPFANATYNDEDPFIVKYSG